jgi:aldose sugar dehydrogenase
MVKRTTHRMLIMLLIGILLLAGMAGSVAAQATGPSMLHSSLGVRSVATGLVTPIGVAFLAANDLLVIEKNTGRVQRIVDGAVQSTVLDLAVNFASERGLLGIALHPNFPENPGVYLFWTCTATPPPAENPYTPIDEECADEPAVGPDALDTNDILAVPLLGNRVDRFIWDGSALSFDQNLIKLRAFQHDAAPEPPGQGDAAQPPRGNHNGGVIAFGPDGKLYIIFGDQGRRGQLQNLACGPTATCPGSTVPDDQFGGPEPDDAHLSGVILRLNDDGSTPADNPFHSAGAALGGEVGENIQKIFAYGIRNSFGMAFDPISGDLWEQENGDDSFDEINRVRPGMNSGWAQFMGPLQRIKQFKEIELSLPPSGGLAGAQLQQIRWPVTNIADRAADARSRLFSLPGSHYSNPEFSWKYAVPPSGIGFVKGRALGSRFEGDLFVGAATPQTVGGYLFHFDLSRDRRDLDLDNRQLRDRVADNTAKHDITESEPLLIGRDFGVVTDIETGPNGNLFAVSLSQGALYEIFRR